MATSLCITGGAALRNPMIPAMSEISGLLCIEVSFRVITQPVRWEVTRLFHMPLCHAGRRGSG